MNWAVIAAFAAAALSLVNVIVGYRLASRGHLEQWQRDETRPIVARILTLSQDALRQWNEAAYARQAWMPMHGDPRQSSESQALKAQEGEHWVAGTDLWGKLRFEMAQLDLVAARSIRDAAHALVWGGHEPVRICPQSQRAAPGGGLKALAPGMTCRSLTG